jgi:hypothetical protein
MPAQRDDRRRFGRTAAGAFAAIAIAAAVAALAVGGCAVLGVSHDLTLSESQLALMLARQFPIERRVLEVVDLNVANPQVHLLPDANRLGTEFDVSAQDRLFGSAAQAHVRLDYGLRFEPADHSIRMTDVRVRELTLVSGSSTLHGAAQRLGTLVAEDVLENQPLYKMKPAQADEMDRLDLVASPIRVTPQGLAMRISPRGG